MGSIRGSCRVQGFALRVPSCRVWGLKGLNGISLKGSLCVGCKGSFKGFFIASNCFKGSFMKGLGFECSFRGSSKEGPKELCGMQGGLGFGV